MPYRNIVFAKLEKRLLNDPRWFSMSDGCQLFYVKLILAACETYNRVPKDVQIVKGLCRLHTRNDRIKKQLDVIKRNFPKFKESDNYYYFEGFNEKTNYISDDLGVPREIPGSSQGVPKEATEYSIVDKDKDKDKEKEKKQQSVWFTDIFGRYPNCDGRKLAQKYFLASVKTEKDFKDISKALKNYLSSAKVKKGYVKNASTWFDNWRDWIDFVETETEPRRSTHAQKL